MVTHDFIVQNVNGDTIKFCLKEENVPTTIILNVRRDESIKRAVLPAYVKEEKGVMDGTNPIT